MKTNTTAEKIPRPLNSFMIYRLEKQKEVLEQCPGANHRDISKIVSKWWNNMSIQEKDPYIKEADKLKREHRKKYPQYKFSPTKKKATPRPYNRKPIHELSVSDVKRKERLFSRYSKELTFDDVFQTGPSTVSSPSDNSSTTDANASSPYYYPLVPCHDLYYPMPTCYLPPIQTEYAYFDYGYYDPLIN